MRMFESINNSIEELQRKKKQPIETTVLTLNEVASGYQRQPCRGDATYNP